MISELEQEFYNTFGIEKRYIILEDDYGQYQTHEKLYSKITAEKLLEMICILNNYGKYDCWAVTVPRLKDAILEKCIAVVISKLLNDNILEQFKQKIQQLLQEDNQ